MYEFHFYLMMMQSGAFVYVIEDNTRLKNLVYGIRDDVFSCMVDALTNALHSSSQINHKNNLQFACSTFLAC